MKFKTFVISLSENNNDRRKSVCNQLEKVKLSFEFIDAVDGKTIVKENDIRLSDHSSWMRNGQLGCSLSHFKC